MAGKEIQRWGDTQQFHQEPMPDDVLRYGPQVTILNATPDPLGTIAAITALYSGRVVRDLSELTHEERRKAYEDMMKTTLNSALEAVQFTILFEGVNRSFTHQMVRGRHAQYIQESLRFAVPEDWANTIPLPPWLAGRGEDDPMSRRWQKTLNALEDAYALFVDNGMPAEEARDILPHAILTRIHWNVSLRELLHVAGLRTCTQAQFVWRQVFAQLAKALREYGTIKVSDPELAKALIQAGIEDDNWQFQFLADNVIRPVCYQTGQCAFLASFDRECNIRERVIANGKAGRPSSEWDKWGPPDPNTAIAIPPINPAEWLVNPGAARKVG